MIIISMLVVFNVLAFENNFFRFEVPKNWELKSENGIVPEVNNPYEINVFLENKCLQFFYTFISKQIVNPKDVIYVHIESKLDNNGLESLCSYTEEDFKGFKAIKYSFCGRLFGAYGRGTAYSFQYNGYVLLFVNFFVPNVLENRKEYNVWDNLKIFTKDKWELEWVQ
jgi:hypothetical protein